MNRAEGTVNCQRGGMLSFLWVIGDVSSNTDDIVNVSIGYGGMVGDGDNERSSLTKWCVVGMTSVW